MTNNEDKKSDAVTSSNPGGSSGDIQYNNAGAFGGSPNLFWDNTDGTVTITKTSNNSQSGLDVTVPTGQDNQYSIRAFTTAAHYSALTADVVIGNGVSTRDSIVVSGTTSGSGTSYNIKAPTSDPTMLALWSDVTGPAEIIASSAATLGNNLLYGVLDGGGGTGVNKFYTLEIDPYGSYFMGSSTNTSNTGWDTGFSRIAAGVTGFGNGTRLSTSGTVETTNFVSVPRGTATGSTQFSSGTLSLEGSYWTGSAANTDSWNITGSHGAFGADAAQILTITPTNPQAQTPQMNLNAALVLNSGSQSANSLISLTDANSNIGFFSNNNNPQGILSWYLDNGARKWTVGTNFLTSNDFEFSNGSEDLVVINHSSGAIKAPAYISAGKTFTATGCGTPTSLTGGATAGSFLAQATSCTVTVTMGNLTTAPNGLVLLRLGCDHNGGHTERNSFHYHDCHLFGYGCIGRQDHLWLYRILGVSGNGSRSWSPARVRHTRMAFSALSAVQDMLRILFLGENWYGSCARACCYALRRLGCDVTDIDVQTFFPQLQNKSSRVMLRIFNWHLVREYNAAILRAAETFRPDLLLSFKAQYVQPHTLRALRGHGISLYNYYPDTSAFAHGPLLAQSLPEYDCVFYTKRFWDQDVRQRVSLRESAYVRHGYDAVIHRPIELGEHDKAQYQSDVVVIATHTKYKEKVLHGLLGLRPGMKLTVWGNQWRQRCTSPRVKQLIKGDPLVGDSYAKGICGAKINLALLSGKVQGSSRGDETTTTNLRNPSLRRIHAA